MNRIGKIGLCVLALATEACSAAELGRLFYTPEQRARMDYEYARAAQSEGDSRRTLSVNGIVQKRGGPRTIWINGVPQPAGKGGDRSAESATVSIPGQKKQIRLKVGEKIRITPSGPEQ